MRAISRALIIWSGDRVVPTDSDLEYARFGMDLSQIGEQSCCWSQKDVEAPGMKVGMLMFDPSTDKSSDIGKICI